MLDWTRVRFGAHVREAAVVVAECHVVLGWEGVEQATYAVRVFRSLVGGGDDPYFAIGTSPADPQGFQPLGGGETPEAAVEACLAHAGIHHRRRVKQATDA